MCTTPVGSLGVRILQYVGCRRKLSSLSGTHAFSSSALSSSRPPSLGTGSAPPCMPPPIHRHGSLLLQSEDTLGIVSAVSDVVLKHGLNMTGADVHIEKGRKRKGKAGRLAQEQQQRPEHDTFLCRFSFETKKYPPGNTDIGSTNSSSFAFDDSDSTESFNLQSFEEHVSRVVASFHAEATLLHQSGRFVKFDGTAGGEKDGMTSSRTNRTARRHVLRSCGPARAAIFVSKRDHCLNDLIDQCRGGELPVQIARVVSNFERTEVNSHVYRALNRLNIPYHYVPCGDSGREKDDWERDIRSVMDSEGGSHQTDFVVLARFMQIFSPDFLQWYSPLPIINIHHGLLPSFKGSNPYRQAFDAGVKLIGATAHFVTEELDEGPIITQAAKTVTHRDGVRDVRMKSERLEANALHDAVRLVAENRVARVGGRTIVFE